MKRCKQTFKKGQAIFLSFVMAAGVVAAMLVGANTVYAANDIGTEPSVSAYVEKEQMMDGTFAPNSSGEAANIGKLIFGKNENGEAQQWYILGKDDSVSGDNTIIFATNPIATGQKFDSSISNKIYSYKAGTGYGNSEESVIVYTNHYGASNLRTVLQNMALDESYFIKTEQGLMNPTTVETKDTLNNVIYTTTDKLYALQGDENSPNETKLWVGSSNGTVLSMESYWSRGDWIWLRSPDDDDGIDALLASPGDCVDDDCVDYERAIQPATNLNLSSVLFASAVTAASSSSSGTIEDGTAMTLRLDGADKNIGAAIYNAKKGTIEVKRGSTLNNVVLVVQGNDGTNDWYYSKQITESETVNVSDIAAQTNTPASIDLSASKIWLETTNNSERMTYAVNATEVVEIASVAIADFNPPEANTALAVSASCTTTGVSSTKPQITWTPNDSTAGYNTSYTASITLIADTGYEFRDDVVATVLDNMATNVTKNVDGTLTVTYLFSATAKDKLISITAPQSITVANGTVFPDMNLPEQVKIVTEGNTVTCAPVTWNTTIPLGGNYDPAVLTEQTVTLNGTVICPATIDANGVSLNTTIAITISEAGIVGAPQANKASGTYISNQLVELCSATDGAEIYYTLDNSEPSLKNGMKYTGAICVTGTEGQCVQTTIKAIAVKDRMQNSSVETFTYIIEIPETTAPMEENEKKEDVPFIKDGKGKEGWDDIRNQMDTVKEGDTVEIDMNGTTVVPGNVIGDIKGKDITIVFDMGDGVTWSVNGKSVTAEDFKDIDFSVKYGTATIPVDVINNVTGERHTMQISLAHEGEFGFTAVLSINMDSRNAGLYANLYYYNVAAGKLEFICADEISTDGIAELIFTHASDYVIVLDTEPMDGSQNAENQSPETDDITPIIWLFVLLLMSGAGLIVTGQRRERY